MKILDNIKNIHFVGIGGISMSGLAEITLSSNYKVTGSDINNNHIVNKLIKKGIKINIPHDSKNVVGSDLVVYTAAVGFDNPELIHAKELGIPLMDRATYLGIIMKNYQYRIAISGCHGKTSTTSLVSIILKNANLDPTVLLGGELDAIGGNVRVGGSEYFVTEACEYVESFLKFYPFIGAILNVEEDHLDYFKDINHIISAFEKFTALIPKDGSLVVCADNENALYAAKSAKCNILTYGIENTADFMADNISYDSNGHPCFDVLYKGQKLETLNLKARGTHNILNTLAATAISINAGISIDVIKKSIVEYTGTHRRFDIQGTHNNIVVVDDYAHHPTEIRATLDAAKQYPHKKLWCVFQPHTYSRTKALFGGFSSAFYDADKVIVTDIYASREKNKGEIHSKDLVDGINKNSRNAVYEDDFNHIVEVIANEVEPGDLVLTMGAGDINKLGPMILKSLK